jgi:hypothetical protein
MVVRCHNLQATAPMLEEGQSSLFRAPTPLAESEERGPGIARSAKVCVVRPHWAGRQVGEDPQKVVRLLQPRREEHNSTKRAKAASAPFHSRTGKAGSRHAENCLLAPALESSDRCRSLPRTGAASLLIGGAARMSCHVLKLR